MTMFDGSTPTAGNDGGATPGGSVATAESPNGVPAAAPTAGAPNVEIEGEDFPATSLLDQVAQQVQTRDVEYAEPWEKRIPDTGLMLVCDRNFEHDQFERWRRLATPKPKGMRGRQMAADNMNQLLMSARALVETNVAVKVLDRASGEWRVLRHGDEDLTLDSKPLMDKFGAIDPIVLVRRLFGRDAKVIEAGMELLEAAGYGDEDESDPTEPVAPRASGKRGKRR